MTYYIDKRGRLEHEQLCQLQQTMGRFQFAIPGLLRYANEGLSHAERVLHSEQRGHATMSDYAMFIVSCAGHDLQFRRHNP